MEDQFSHFSMFHIPTKFEIINHEQQFEKAVKYTAIQGIFLQIEAKFFLKNAWLPLILFLDSNNPC